MKLTKATDFALRVLIYLSESNELRTMPQMSQVLGISYNNLTKIVQTLSKANLIHTKQGKNGGIRLVVSPDSITLRRVVELIDGPTRLSECIGHPGVCELDESCKLKSTLGRVQSKIDKLLEEVNLGEIISDGREEKKEILS